MPVDLPAPSSTPSGPAPRGPTLTRPRWLPTRIRSKLIVLHTMFSLLLGAVLLIALRQPLRRMMDESESREAIIALALYRADESSSRTLGLTGVRLSRGSAAELGLSSEQAQNVQKAAGAVVVRDLPPGWLTATEWDPASQRFLAASVRIIEAHAEVDRLYLLLTLSLLAAYGLIALTLEVFVLPKQVYSPISTLLRADEAARARDLANEVVPAESIPGDEFGQIMRSRNLVITTLREKEHALETALQSLEQVANELKRKNHLLETARRNLADQDRLASLGMMSAGIAHELNTPLAVLKGTVEEVAASEGRGIGPERSALMLRVLGRLERLSESLLDFARARPPRQQLVPIRALFDEAWTLVSIDRGARAAAFSNTIPQATTVLGDPDRLTQVLVNLLRNAVDALDDRPGLVRASLQCSTREGQDWTSLLIEDNGPGIDPHILPRLFEPFASTRLDSHGTGLGLAVAEGIIREHGGLLLARNSEAGGAIFEIMLPGELTPGPCPETPAPPDAPDALRALQPGEHPPVHSHPA